jgi:hypothetical protein
MLPYTHEVPTIFMPCCSFQRCLKIISLYWTRTFLKYLMATNHQVFKIILNPTWILVLRCLESLSFG